MNYETAHVFTGQVILHDKLIFFTYAGNSVASKTCYSALSC